MAEDIIDVEILSDGRIRTENGKISAPNHMVASQLFRMLEELTGGETERQKRQPGRVHVHDKIVEKE